LEERRQSVAEYERFGIQRMTGEEVSRPICRSIHNQGGNIYQCGQVMTTNLNKNPFSCKHQLDSMIQGASERTEKEEGKPVEVEEVKEWEVEKILNKRKIREVDKYLV